MVKYVLLKSTVPVTQLDRGIGFRYAGFDIVDVQELDEPVEGLGQGCLSAILNPVRTAQRQKRRK